MVQAVYRQPPGSGPWMCCADGCTQPAAMQWQRCAPGNSDGTSTVPVMCCAADEPAGTDLTLTHESTCAAPKTCTCTPLPPPT